MFYALIGANIPGLCYMNCLRVNGTPAAWKCFICVAVKPRWHHSLNFASESQNIYISPILRNCALRLLLYCAAVYHRQLYCTVAHVMRTCIHTAGWLPSRRMPTNRVVLYSLARRRSKCSRSWLEWAQTYTHAQTNTYIAGSRLLASLRGLNRA